MTSRGTRYGSSSGSAAFTDTVKSTTASSLISSRRIPERRRLLHKLLDRLREIRTELGTDQVFDVVGEIMPANLLERLLRDMYARRLNVNDATDRIVEEVDPNRFRAITDSRLRVLRKKAFDLSAIIGKSVEATQLRLVPEAIEQFFLEAAPTSGIQPKELASNSHTYRIGKVPRLLTQRGNTVGEPIWPVGKRICESSLYEGVHP